MASRSKNGALIVEEYGGGEKLECGRQRGVDEQGEDGGEEKTLTFEG